MQLTWIVLTILKKRKKEKKLERWKKKIWTGLYYSVDDILPPIKTESKCLGASVSLLNFLGLFGYRVSKKIA